MKLCEIYDDPYDQWIDPDDQDSTWISPKTREAVSRARATPGHTFVGAGSNAYVGTNDKDNFGDVHRISNRGEGGAVYLQSIYASRSMRSNPYLPRVRAVTQNKHTTIIQSERLVPFATPAVANKRMMKLWWDKCFTKNVMPFPAESYITTFCSILHTALARQRWEDIRDPQLAEAMLFILETAEDSDTSVDIHHNNIMWRMSLYQPQLVLVDPIA